VISMYNCNIIHSFILCRTNQKSKHNFRAKKKSFFEDFVFIQNQGSGEDPIETINAEKSFCSKFLLWSGDEKAKHKFLTKGHRKLFTQKTNLISEIICSNSYKPKSFFLLNYFSIFQSSDKIIFSWF
jgi:hypothetical protein